MGLFDTTVPFKGQKYKDIKSNCIKKGTLFVDPVFPPSGRSLYYKRAAPTDIVWKRPGVGVTKSYKIWVITVVNLITAHTL